MNIEEIRAKAPEGATHYIAYKNGLIIYYKYVEGIQFAESNYGMWLRSFASHQELKPL